MPTQVVKPFSQLFARLCTFLLSLSHLGNLQDFHNFRGLSVSVGFDKFKISQRSVNMCGIDRRVEFFTSNLTHDRALLREEKIDWWKTHFDYLNFPSTWRDIYFTPFENYSIERQTPLSLFSYSFFSRSGMSFVLLCAVFLLLGDARESDEIFWVAAARPSHWATNLYFSVNYFEYVKKFPNASLG